TSYLHVPETPTILPDSPPVSSLQLHRSTIRAGMAASTVLLIDNDQDSITIYSLILRHHGYEVVPATDGETGLRLALELKPDIVVTELFLPQLQGPSLLEGL